MRVTDTSGRTILFVDGDRARDESGKVIAHRAGSDSETKQLTQIAADMMAGRMVALVNQSGFLGPADVQTAATRAELGIPEGEYVADIVSRVHLITHDRGVYYAESSLDSIRIVPNVDASQGGPIEISPTYSSTSFTTEARALTARLPRQLLGNADWDLKKRYVIRLVEALKLLREYRIATQLTTSANWASANRVAATAKWNGGTNPDPLTDLFAALLKSVLPANTLILPENAAQYFFANPAVTASTVNRVRDFVQAGGRMPRVLTAVQKSETAGVPAYLWAPTTPANVSLVRDPGNLDRIPTSMTLRWLGPDGNGGQEVEGMLVRQFWSSQDDAYFVVVAHNDYEAFVDNTVGAVITGALA